MTYTLLSIVLAGSGLGSIIARYIPLVPGWIGAIIGAVSLGYSSTFNDNRGDVLRFLGHTMSSVLTEALATAEDVYLREKTMVILGQLLFFMKGIDNRFQILQRLKRVLEGLLYRIQVIISR